MTLVRWIAVALVLDAAVLLIAGIGTPVLWFASILVGAGLLVFDREHGRHSLGY